MAMVACNDCKMLAEQELPTCPYCGSSNRQSALRAEALFENIFERVIGIASSLPSIDRRSLDVLGPVLAAFLVIAVGQVLIESIWPHTLHAPDPAAVTMVAGAPTAQIKPVEAAFSIAVTRIGTDLFVTGRTNLPSQTQLVVTVSAVAVGAPPGRAQYVSVEPDGLFYCGPFGWAPHASRRRGNYRVDIVARPVDEQPSGDVRAMAGHDWSKYTGSLVQRSRAGGKTAPEVKFEFGYDGARDFTFWRDAPAGARKPPLNVSWTRESLDSLIAAKADLTPPPAATTAANRFSSTAPSTHLLLTAHYGCLDREFLGDIIRYAVRRDKKHWEETIAQGTHSGQCILFAPGEEVVVDKVLASEGLIRVRRAGMSREYWIETVATN